MKRNPVAEAATLIEHPDGTRELFWPQDGIRRRYSRQDIAEMFIHCVKVGKMNPLLERLTTSRERAELYAGLQEVSEQVAGLIALADSRLAGDTT